MSGPGESIDIWAEADVCGWPDDDKPLEDPKKHRRFCAGLIAIATGKRIPLVAGDFSDDGFPAFAPDPAPRHLFDPAHAVPPPGRYQVEVVPRNIDRIERGEARGFGFWLRIIDGPLDGCELRFAFITADPSGRLDSVVRHDLQVMGDWLAGLGLGPVVDELDFVRKLIRFGARFDQFVTLGHKRWKRGLDIYIAGVEVRP